MNISSGAGYPAGSLSNFAPHPFEIDGVQCNSMEGFLQGLKFKSVEMQVEVCTLVGRAAKFKGKNKKWFRTQNLYWRGVEMKRDSDEYQDLLDKAYNRMYSDSESFIKALKSTNKAVLTHSMSKNKTNETVLTTKEFISRLNKLREYQKI
jgi:predicted NAD-dependent protein-ADP-ribosyltransferase YbiA (DUF1768 family)